MLEFVTINDETQLSTEYTKWLNNTLYDCWLLNFTISFTKHYFLSLGITLSRSIIYSKYKYINAYIKHSCEQHA